MVVGRSCSPPQPRVPGLEPLVEPRLLVSRVPGRDRPDELELPGLDWLPVDDEPLENWEPRLRFARLDGLKSPSMNATNSA